MTINDLIERLEKTKGPDRGLDAEIALVLGWHVDKNDNWIGPRAQIVVPAYTASVDSALTLVPEGWTRAVDASAPELRIDVTLFPPNDGPDLVGTHSSEPIATCIAALKARSQS